MSARSLHRRLDALAEGHVDNAVIEALKTMNKTGTAPPGRSGEKAQEIWNEVVRRGVLPEIRYLAAYMRATGKSLAELIAESEGYGECEPAARERTDDERSTEVE